MTKLFPQSCHASVPSSQAAEAAGFYHFQFISYHIRQLHFLIYIAKSAAQSSHLVLDVLGLDADGSSVIVGDPLVPFVSVHAFVFGMVLS